MEVKPKQWVKVMREHVGPRPTILFLWSLVILGPLSLAALIFNLVVGPISDWRSQDNEQATVGPSSAKADMLVQPWAVYHVHGGSPLQAYVIFKNSGDAIADVTSWGVGVSVLDANKGDAAATYASLGGIAEEPGKPSFDKGQAFPRFRQRKRLTDKEVDDLKAGKKRIYVFGIIAYRDKSNGQRRTGFCHTYSGSEHVVRDDGTKLYAASQVRLCKNAALNFRE